MTTYVYRQLTAGGLFWRHKVKIIVTFCLLLGASVALMIWCPRTYVSEAKLFVRVGRESVSLDPIASLGETIQISSSRESELSTVRDMLKSRVMMEKVVDALGTDAFRKGGEESEKTGAARYLALALERVRQLDPVSDHETAVAWLEKQVHVVSDRKSNLLILVCRADTPEFAQQVVATLTSVYLEEHARLNRTAGCYAFFAEQASMVRTRLNQAADELRKAKNEVGLLSIEGQRQLLESHVNTLTTELLRTRASLAAAEGKSQALSKSLSGLPERMMTDEVQGYPNQAADEMRKLLYELEIREAELASKFATDYPLLVAIRRQIKEARGVQNSQEPRRTQYTTTLNSVYQQLQGNLLAENASQDSLRAQMNSLDQQYAASQLQLRALNDQEARLARLQRDVQLLEDSDKTYAQKMEQSRIDDALRYERITNVNVVQPAAFIEEPVSPKKRLVLGAGLAAAFFGSIGMALMAEYAGGRRRAASEKRAIVDLSHNELGTRLSAIS